MSSLLQHHGCTTDYRPGKVELLMCLEHWIEEPMKCMNCGREVFFPLQREHFCECGVAIADVFHRSMDQARKHPGESIHWMMWEFWSEEMNAKCRSEKVKYSYCGNHWRTVDSEPQEIQDDKGKWHKVPKLYRIFRKPTGMWGCWVTFRYNGSEHAPDLSVPIHVEKLPRDAEPLTEEEAKKYWFS